MTHLNLEKSMHWQIMTLSGKKYHGCLCGLGAKLGYMGYFASLLHPQEEKTWLLLSVRDTSWGLRNPCFTKISVVSFL